VTVRLVHVGIRESSAKRFFDDEQLPGWSDQDAVGEVSFQKWTDDETSYMVMITTKIQGEQHAVKATIAALYEIAGEAAPQTTDEAHDFVASRLDELMPFMRQAVFTASGQVWPIRPIMLDAFGTLGEAERADSAGN
jgi:hypothetical protein